MFTRADLDRRLTEATTRRERVTALNEWAWYCWFYDLSTAERYAQEAQATANALMTELQPHWAGLAGSFLNMAHLHIRRRNYEEVKTSIDEAWKIYIDLHDIEGQLRCMLVKALQLITSNALEAAFAQLHTAIAIASTDPSYAILHGETEGLVGRVYFLLEDYNLAHTQYQRAYDILEKTESTRLQAQMLLAIARIHLVKNETDPALDYAQRALTLQKTLADRLGEAETLNYITRVYLQMGDLILARERVVSSLMLTFNTDNTLAESVGYKLLAEIELRQGELDEADQHVNRALLKIIPVKCADIEIEIRKLAVEVYRVKGNLDWALMHSEQINTMKSLLLRDQVDKRARNIALPNIADTVRNEIQQHNEQEESLRQRVNELLTVLQMYDEVTSNLKTDSVMSLSLDAALRLSAAQAGFIATFEGDEMNIRQIIGRYETTNLVFPQKLVQQLLNRKTLMMSNEIAVVDGFPQYASVEARMIIPLHINERLIGIINVETKEASRFTLSVLQLMDTLKGYIAIALDNAHLYEQLANQFDELQIAHRQVTTLEQLKTDMIRLASHDLKNPLTVMKLYLSMMKMGAAAANLSSTQLSYIELMEGSVGTMNRLITDILSLERIEQMARNATQEIVDLAERAKDITEYMQMFAFEKKQTLTLKTDLTTAKVHGDHTQLGEAMSNFVSNASKYTPEGGNVEVRLRRNDRWFIVEVQDNGIGITPDEQTKIFAPSYRVSNEETVGIPGTGWGLYLVKKIIEYHHGEIFFLSDFGKGSTFGFRLPVIAE